MSAPLILTPNDVGRLSAALLAFTKATRETEVRFDAYGPVTLYIGPDACLDVRWDEESRTYVITDRVGS